MRAAIIVQAQQQQGKVTTSNVNNFDPPTVHFPRAPITDDPVGVVLHPRPARGLMDFESQQSTGIRRRDRVREINRRWAEEASNPNKASVPTLSLNEEDSSKKTANARERSNNSKLYGIVAIGVSLFLCFLLIGYTLNHHK